MKEIESVIAEKGAAYCSNPDLVSFMFGSMKPEIRSQLVDFINTGDAPLIDELPKVVRVKFQAFVELAERLFVKSDVRINDSRDIAVLCKDMENLSQEHFVVITVDGANCVIAKRTVFIGTVNRTVVHPREVFADAISDRAAGIIIVHNHPSGRFEPSQEDIAMTKRLADVGTIIGIPVIDHVILGTKGHYSFQGNGAL